LLLILTQQAAGLEVIADILETQAVLISNPNAKHKDLVELVKLRLDGYITATKYVLVMYNVSNSILSDALSITPGKRSATITSLDDGESKAVSSLVLANDVNRIMDELHKIGATDILVMEIKNSRM
jgi:ATP phosphoribosyltransferase